MSNYEVVLKLLVHLAFSVNLTTSFLLDVDVVTFIRPPSQNVDDAESRSSTQSDLHSYFGYTFACSRENEEVKFVVGAPDYSIIKEIFDNRNKKITSSSQDSNGSFFSCSSRTTFTKLNKSVECNNTVSPSLLRESGTHFGSTMKVLPDGEVVSCVPNYLTNCSGIAYVPGSCYKTSDSGKSWNPIASNPTEICPDPKLDIIFLLDGSYSVGKVNFGKVKKWTNKLFSKFKDATKKAWFGVIQFSHYVKTSSLSDQRYMKVHIPLANQKKKREFEKEVESIKLFAYQTYTAHALNLSLVTFMDSARWKSKDTSKVLILLTDGKATDEEMLPHTAANVRKHGVKIFSVGVGDYDIDELKQISNGGVSNKRVYQSTTFDDLDAIVGSLIRDVIGVTLEGTGINQKKALLNMESAELGFSTSFSPNSTTGKNSNGRLLLGAVGAYDWSGTVAKYDNAGDKDADIPNYTEVQKVLPNRTKESYLGYSVTTGNYNGAAGGDYAASGAPRYWMRGAVVVYKPTDNSKMFDDAVTINPHADHQQFGSYFGGTLLSMDLNNDGKDDLLVAAPLYIGKESDEGRVFVYITGSGNQNVRDWAASTYKPAELKGRSENGARFGTAMASAGDLNKDGFNDVIIGAPLTEDGRGAVYVYHGSADGIISEPRQRIGASDVQGAKLQYFGQSLQGGVDLDGNNYPDVAVGAPRSDTIAIFRSRPVANFVTSVTFTKSKIDIFNCLEQQNRQCQNLTVCITISGIGVEPTATVDLKIRLDPTFGRLQFRSRADSSNGQLEQSILNETLVLNNRSCFPREIYLKSKIDNYNDPATAIFTYELTKEHTSKPLSSISDPSKPHSQQSEFTFEKKCAGKSICEYDLDLQAQLILPQSKLENGADLTEGGKRLVVASETDKTIIVQVNLTNTQQSAFDAQVVVEYSPQLSWNEITNVVSSNKKHQNCMQDKGQPVASGTNSSTKVIQYEYDEMRGNIMPKDHWCAFKIKLTWDKLKEDGTLPEVFIKLNAGTLNSQNDSVDITPGNNMKTENIPVIYKSNVDGKRLRSEDNVQLNVTETNYTISHVNEISKDIVQVRYKIFGRGYSNIPLSHISITYPAKFDDGLYLLYLYDYTCMTRDTPEMKTNCTCDTSVVNKLGLQVNNEKGVNETFSNATIIPNPNPFTLSEIDCNNATTASKMCETLRCSVENLDETQSVSVEARFRVWIPTFSFVMNKTERTVMKVDFNFNSESSSLVLNKDGEKPIKYTGQTDMIAELFRAPTEIQQSNQIWIYIVAGIAGVLLLLLAVFILYKCGFFKSKYAQKKEELEWQEADGAEEAT